MRLASLTVPFNLASLRDNVVVRLQHAGLAHARKRQAHAWPQHHVFQTARCAAANPKLHHRLSRSEGSRDSYLQAVSAFSLALPW